MLATNSEDGTLLRMLLRRPVATELIPLRRQGVKRTIQLDRAPTFHTVS